MKTLLFAAITSLFFATGSIASDHVNTSGKSGVAINGYDPVAFFTEGKPVNGDPGIKAEHEGATYFFATKANRKAFEENPVSYAPQFGGYCAFGVAVGQHFPIDIQTWQIVDGKLYLNLNPAVQELFNKDLQKTIQKAEKNWVKLADHS